MLPGNQDQKFYTVKDVSAQDFIRGYADYLKKNNKLEVPKFHDFVKLAVRNELSPLDPDWLYVRAAALARKVYLRPHTGVGNLKHLFGGQIRRGVRPNHHSAAHGKVIRYCLQQLEKIGVVKRDKKGHDLKKNSRVITKEGQTDLNRIATQVVLNKAGQKK